MEGKRARQALPPGDRPRRVRSRSHGDIRDACNNTTTDRIHAGKGNWNKSPDSSHMPAPYASHLRESSRTSWDGGLPQPASRTPSPSPPQSPTRRRYQPPQGLSAVSLPDHSRRSFESLRPTVLADRWSYDRERMPSPPPPRSHISRPGTPTPLSEQDGDVSEFGFSRPASTLTASRPSSRPQSIVLDTTSTDPAGSPHNRPSSPTLMVTPPPDSSSAPEQYSDLKGDQLPQRLGRRSFHSLTTAEMEILSHLPPAHPPMSASSSRLPSRSPEVVASPNSQQSGYSKELTSPAPEKQRNVRRDDEGGDGEEEDEMTGRGCCLGLCEIGTAQRIGGTCGAWLMGTLLPIGFGTLLKFVGHIFAGCPS
ncbi:hypothetical protein C8A03DRAFT_14096 [Achaetomium macrosporum]|uniref:Uncharacterized protein n=1 Tax=Achaetomium macrosporum TaxID=79813 RepID=A0AAN7HCA3_9PEZI|nr:hypothetical protein C8A03DRAFT_14096 [Achaetomium macrosporum]